jgi:acyl carrier protein
MTTTFDAIRAIIMRDFELPPERLQHDTLLEEIELDSLAITELVFQIEDEFKITADNTFPPFKTLGDIADYVARLVAERDAKPSPAPKRAAAKAKRAAVKAKPASATKHAAPRAAGTNDAGVAKPAAGTKRAPARTSANAAPPGKRKRSSARGGARAR